MWLQFKNMKAHTDLPHFLVLLLFPLLLLLLQLDSLLLVLQPLISLRQEGKMNFSVTSLGLRSFTCVMVIRAVQVALIIHLMHVHTDEEDLELLQLSGM